MSKQPTRRAITGVLLAAALAVAAAACSSDAEDGSSTVVTTAAAATTTVAGSTTSGSTTAIATATSTVAATAAPATVAPTTSVPATTAVIESTTTQPPSVVDVSVQPGASTDGYVGARTDVSGETCAANGADFASAGTVTNPTKATASYRVYSALVRPNGTTAAVIEADVTSVRAGKSAGFSSVLPGAAGPFQCVLRVERTAG